MISGLTLSLACSPLLVLMPTRLSGKGIGWHQTFIRFPRLRGLFAKRTDNPKFLGRGIIVPLSTFARQAAHWVKARVRLVLSTVITHNERFPTYGIVPPEQHRPNGRKVCGVPCESDSIALSPHFGTVNKMWTLVWDAFDPRLEHKRSTLFATGIGFHLRLIASVLTSILFRNQLSDRIL